VVIDMLVAAFGVHSAATFGEIHVCDR